MRLFDPLRPAASVLKQRGPEMLAGAALAYVASYVLRDLARGIGLGLDRFLTGNAALLGCALVMIWLGRRLGKEDDVLGCGRPLRGILTGVIGYVLAVGPVTGIHWLYVNHILTPEQRELRQPTVDELLAADVPRALIMGLVLATVVPLFEEVLFRGWVQNGLKGCLLRVLGGRSAAVCSVIGAATLFTLVHPPYTWVVIMTLGLIVGVLYHLTHSLWAVATFHACHNAWTVIYLRLSES